MYPTLASIFLYTLKFELSNFFPILAVFTIFTHDPISINGYFNRNILTIAYLLIHFGGVLACRLRFSPAIFIVSAIAFSAVIINRQRCFSALLAASPFILSSLRATPFCIVLFSHNLSFQLKSVSLKL
jgi:hypothetical protein